MNIKIQNSGKNGATNTKGSCRALAQYCEHEDDERRKLGKTVFPFATADGTPVSTEEVIDKIDRNGVCLHKGEDRHYMITINPSVSEVRAMGKDDQELYENAKILMKHILDAYAEGFHNAVISDSSDLEVFWKPHYTRGENGEDQFHIHVIVSRRAKGKGVKISPMTNHRDTKTGPVKGGFDRKAFFERGEKLFDQLFNYERKVAESFEYLNVMAHGTAEEKGVQAERLARENENAVRAELEASFSKRRKRKKANDEVDELSMILKRKDYSLSSPKADLYDSIEIANVGAELMKALTISHDKLAFELNLASLGYTIKPKFAENGGVENLIISYKGHSTLASKLLDNQKFITLLVHWQRLFGQEPAYLIRERQEKQEANRKIKLTLNQHGQSLSRGPHLKR